MLANWTKILALLLPFLLLIGVNEYSRYSLPMATSKRINTAQQLSDACSWACHNQTTYCKNQHVNISEKYWHQTDEVFFGITGLLGRTGQYRLMNILILALFIPALMYYLLVRIINLEITIRQQKIAQNEVD